jgi:nodulation protein E
MPNGRRPPLSHAATRRVAARVTARTVVVTGLGCISGLGVDVGATWDALMAGTTAIRPIRKVIAGEAELTFDGVGAPVDEDGLRTLTAEFGEQRIAPVDLFANLAATATLEALKDAGLWPSPPLLGEAAIIYGSASGGLASLETGYQRMFRAGLPNVHPMTIPRYMNSASVSHLSMLFGIRGHCLAVSSACASSAHAIGEAMHFIRAGRASIVVTGGSDASLTFGSLHGWKAIQAMAPDACRPFSLERKGLVLGEGAATLVLEDAEHARRRGARVYAEVAGSGTTADAGHITRPDGDGAAAAIRAAHRDADLGGEEPLLVSAHGTGTRLNDRAEALALQHVYGHSLQRHRVIATKSAHGHLMGATGAMEFLIAILALCKQAAPPILGFIGADPECDLPLVLRPEALACKAAVSASFGFGGLNSVLVAKAV